MITKDLADKINGLAQRNLAFAFYYHPAQPEPHLVVQRSCDLLKVKSYGEISGASGFILAPFARQEETPAVLLHPDIYLTDTASILALDLSPLPHYSLAADHDEEIAQISQDDYIATVRSLIAQMEEEKTEKVVLSRIITAPLPSGYSPGVFVQRLKETMGNAFVYFCHIPGTGTWMGATPEALLTTQKGRWKTASLAGTLPASAEKILWSAKEKREQEIVTEFIEEQLRAFAIHDYVKTGPCTAYAGPVAHLKTDIEFPAIENHEDRGRFIDALHPTPAVCGVPREKAMTCIDKYERHKREYYSGFLGEWNLPQEMNLYVNLRCMKTMRQEACLFVGGGITRDSSPEKEWEETNYKSQTILSLLRPRP